MQMRLLAMFQKKKDKSDFTIFEFGCKLIARPMRSQLNCFYLGLLLNNIKGSISYEDIRTVDGIVYFTFEDTYNTFLI